MKQVIVKEWGGECIVIGGKPHTLVHEDDMPPNVGNIIIDLNDRLIKAFRDMLDAHEQLNNKLKHTHNIYE